MVPRIAAPMAYFLLTLALSPMDAAAQEAERPTAMSLFPSETVLFVRTADARDLIDRIQQTAGVRMLRDPALAPFVGSIERSARQAYEEHAREHVEMDLDSLTRLPQGEVAFGVVEREGTSPAIAAVADFRGEVDAAQELLDRAQQLAQERGGIVSEEQLRNDTATTIRSSNDQKDAIGVVRRGEVFVIASDRDLLQTMLDRWDGIEVDAAAPPLDDEDAADDDEESTDEPKFTGRLSENLEFASGLQECLRGRAGPPQLVAFVDPISFVRAVAGQQMGVRMALAALPILGVDRIEGASGAWWASTDTWDMLVRGHLLIDNPRVGVMRIARLEGGDMTPPTVVPASIANYTTVNIDAQRVFNETAKIVDRFRGSEGRFQEDVRKRSTEAVGFDFEQELLPILTGRATVLSAFEEDTGSIGGQTVVVAGVNDEDEAKRLLGVLAEKYADNTEKRSFGATEYYAAKGPQPPSDEEGEDAQAGPRQGPPFTPAAGVFGGAIVLSSSEAVLKKMIEAHEGAAPRLRDELQYKLVASRIRRLAGGRDVGMLSYENPEASLRHWYALGTSAQTRERLDGFDNPVGAALRDALDAGELPPVETLLKYAAPSGSLVYDTDTGFHYMAFGFKPAIESTP